MTDPRIFAWFLSCCDFLETCHSSASSGQAEGPAFRTLQAPASFPFLSSLLVFHQNENSYVFYCLFLYECSNAIYLLKIQSLGNYKDFQESSKSHLKLLTHTHPIKSC